MIGASARYGRRRGGYFVERFQVGAAGGSSLEAEVTLSDLGAILGDYRDPRLLSETFITGTVHLAQSSGGISVARTSVHKCGRCWRHLPEVEGDGALCDRCETVVA